DMAGNPLNFLLSLLSHFVQERHEGVLVKPGRCFGLRGNAWQLGWSLSEREITQNCRLLLRASAVRVEFDGEQAFVDDLAQTVHYAGTVEVQPRRVVVIQGVKAGTLGKFAPSQVQRVPANRLEKGMPRRDPLQIILVGRRPVSRAAGVLLR